MRAIILIFLIGLSFSMAAMSMNQEDNSDLNSTQIAKRVLNGVDAPKNKYKWVASIIGDNHKGQSVGTCGSSIIDRQWLLSSAHCFLHLEDGGKVLNLTDPSVWHARLGVRKVDFKYTERQKIFREKFDPNSDEDEENDIEEDEEDDIDEDEEDDIDEDEDDEDDEDEEDDIDELVSDLDDSLDMDKRSHSESQSSSKIHLHFEKIFIYPKYKSGNVEYDIALIKLKSPIRSEYVGVNGITEILPLPPAANIQNFPTKNLRCVVVGWGCRKLKGKPSQRAQLAHMKIISNKYCKRAFRNNTIITDNHEFCAKSVKRNQGLCPGDSGSGLACKYNGRWTLAGTTSATHSRKPSKYPTLFTKVQFFNDWIRKHMKNN